ncbi:MarR family winged helix-turn-helix transcriptional regulator [Cohnella zeiphila]|uniref:MarR family winged helix-turn-helix transcriptional regulator n=1 Tax=Cohnella zeiphila TaxID=2761120 RepID=UPI001EE2FB74|nr:MarR family transcriptional regulator [Cohnella zeiphila]
MKDQTQKIAENFIRFLPLVYNRMDKTALKNNPEAGQTSLTHLQQHILEELAQTEAGISVTRLANSIRISKQQLTPLIMKLEEAGYVSKNPDPIDRRAVLLLLTDKGKDIVTRHWGEFYRAFTGRIAALSEEDLNDLDYAIDKIVRIFERMERGDGARR